MKAKTALQLLSLSANLYVIMHDEALMKTLSDMAEKGKEKLHDVLGHGDEDAEESGALLSMLLEKAKEAKAGLEERMGKLAETVYAKMNIAHTKEIAGLQDQITVLESKLLALENRLAILEQPNKIA